eukprot:jgi/Undpi1/4954/HiC_scaffold_19.g08306.m1
MSKKRGRSTAASKADEGPDAQFAEELMFQLASDDNEPENPPSAKRGNSTSAKILPTSSAGTTDLTGADLDDSVTTAAEGGESTSAAAQEPSNGKHPAAIRPSSSLRHCDGFDVVRKGSRGRGRQLMVLPGALGLGGGSAGGTAGVKLGVLNTATPGCPVLYVEFPEGRLKCMGRTVHTKGRFFTLYADKVAERATRMDCRDVFDSVVFFGKACWVGKKEDNPEDEPLPLPESLHFLSAEEEAPDGREPALKTHFGGGNPKSLLAGSKEGSSKKPKDGVAGADPEEAGDEGENEGGDGESAAAAAAEPARRSSRATKSTATYVEDSDDSENDDDGISSSSSGSDNEGDDDDGERKGTPNFAAVTTKNGKGKEKVKEGGAAKDGVEVFSILDAPTAKRKPVTIGSGKVESAKKTPAKKKGGGKNGTMSSGKGKGKGRRAVGGSSDDDGTSGSSSDEGGVEVVAAEPSRRSSRASAASKVKYTQSSGSEEEEEEEEDEDDEEDF